MYSKTFCAMPFVSLMINTNSYIKFCCIAQPDSGTLTNSGKKLKIGQNSLEEAWNSDSMISLRNAMLNGEEISACTNCYKQEAINKRSFRQMMTDEWKWKLGPEIFNNLIEDIRNNEGYSTLPPIYLDLRLGNLCNLKCRMCNPFNSSQIAKEHFDLYETDANYKSVWTSEFGNNPEYLKEEQIVFDSNFLWNEIIEFIPYLKKVYLTGGEPTLIKNNYRFMEECIHSDNAKDIELFFNINCTNVTSKFLNLISQFKFVKINVSIDGIGKINDYIRAGSNWKKIDENFKKLVKLENTEINISPVVQTYNLFHFHEILDYANEITKKYSKPIGVDFLINYHPHHLDITSISEEHRSIALNNLVPFQNNENITHTLTINSINGIINLLKSPRREDYKKQLAHFKLMTKALDKKRNISLKDVSSLLAEIINYDE